MSAERYKISECELDVLAITGPEGTRYIDGEEIEARVIRQQSADIAELRAELAAAVAERDSIAIERDHARLTLREIAQILIEQIGSVGPENAVNAALRACEVIESMASRLSAIYSAPVVAWLSTDCIGERYLCFSAPDGSDPVVELIARPSRESTSPIQGIDMTNNLAKIRAALEWGEDSVFIEALAALSELERAAAQPAPKFEAPEVTRPMCHGAWARFWSEPNSGDSCDQAKRWLEAWRTELGPALGLVELREPTPEECERIEEEYARNERRVYPRRGRDMADAVIAVMWPKEGL